MGLFDYWKNPPPDVPPPSTPVAPTAPTPNVTNLPAHPMSPTPLSGYLASAPSFSLDTPPPATPAQGAYDPNRSGLANMLGIPQARPGLPNAAALEHENRVQTMQAAPGALDYAANFMFGDSAGSAKLNNQSKNAAIMSQGPISQYVNANPEAAKTIAGDLDHYAPILDQAFKNASAAKAGGMHTYVGPDGTTKDVTPENPASIAAQAAILGEHPKNVTLFAEPHHFTEEEFAHHISGMSWNQAARIFGMQHYQTPQQQLVPAFVGNLHATANAAEKAYNDAVTAGKPKGDQDKLKDAWTMAATKRDTEIEKLINASNYPYPGVQ